MANRMKVDVDKFDGENYVEISLNDIDMSLLDEGRLLSHNLKIGTKLFNIGIRYKDERDFIDYDRTDSEREFY